MDLTDDQLKAAIVVHTRTGRWFPEPADILTIHKGLNPNRPELRQIPEHTGEQYTPSKAEWDALKARVRKIGSGHNFRRRRACR